jgi:phytoene synthase
MNPEDIMAYHARSFAPATRFLPRRDRHVMARLYVLCRTVDDIADEIGGPVGQRQLQDLQDDLCLQYPKGRLGIEAHDLFHERPSGLSAFADLVAAAAADTGSVCITDNTELDQYCMGVAGTVGVMVCSVFNIDAPHHAKAADLGKAMQLTNICRDVLEDARNGRRYLPFTLCPHAPSDIAAGVPESIASAEDAMQSLLGHADHLYLSGRSALVVLPLRLRLAVVSAAAMYEGIGTELRHRGYQPLAGRAVVPKGRKVRLAVRAVFGELLKNRYRQDRSDRVNA